MSSVKKNYIYNLFYQVLAIIIPLITTPYLSRILNSQKLGVYSFNYSVAYYFSLFIMLGLNNYGNRTIASSRDNEADLCSNFINLYAFQLICGFIVSTIYIVYTFTIASDKIAAMIFFLYILGAILDINWLFFGLEQFKLTVMRNALVKLLSTVLIFIFVKNIDDVYIYCIIFSFSYLLSQLCLWTFIKKNIRFVHPKISEIKKHIKPNLILFITVLLVSLFKTMDKIMLGLFSDYNEVGFYESSEKIIALPIALITTLGTVMLPRTTNLMANNKDTEAQKYINHSIIFAMFISSSMCFGIMGVSREFVPWFYGKGFDKCIWLFISLLPSCLFLGFANVIRTQYLLPKKMDKSYIISAAVGAAINIIINLLLIPRFGALGAAIGTLCAEASVCVYQVSAVRKHLPVMQYIKETFPFIIDGCIMFVVLFFLRLNFDNLFVNMIIKIVIGFFLYIVLLVFYNFIYKKIKNNNWIDYSEYKKMFMKKLIHYKRDYDNEK